MTTSGRRERVVVVGAGHAGVALSVTLAKAGQHDVVLMGAESCLPYERPPLTKKALTSTSGYSPPLLRSADYWAKSPVDLRTGTRVVRVDPDRRVVETDAGHEESYDVLAWATGGTALSPGLPGEGLAGVHRVRETSELAPFLDDLASAASAVVVGGGYVGLETAAALRSRGLNVTVVELGPRVLNRVAGAPIADYFADLHRARGVRLMLGTSVSSFAGRDGRLAEVVLSNGTTVAADIAVLGVGMTPAVHPLLEAGAKGDVGGIDVDEHNRTSLDGVYALGDCVRQLSPWSPTRSAMRIESVHNASVQAVTVAASLAGTDVGEPPPPRFWSHQYDAELKSVGFPSPDDEVMLRGRPDEHAFSVLYVRDGRLAAIDTVNRPRDFARAQALVAARWPVVVDDALFNPSVDLPRLR